MIVIDNMRDETLQTRFWFVPYEVNCIVWQPFYVILQHSLVADLFLFKIDAWSI
jgi:hypothetical protein